MGSFVRASVVALLVLTACGGHSASESAAPQNAAVLQVENQGFTDMVIYAYGTGGQRTRLGLATGNSTKSFNIPGYLVGGAGPLRFLADPMGASRGPVSDEMVVQPGDVVSLTIPPQ
jgi:hypothetical protein